jgi:hypothetical protein
MSGVGILARHRPDPAPASVSYSSCAPSSGDVMSQLWSYPILILACLTLGLAPFLPQPHVVEKLRMLFAGTLTRPIDIFDLLLHAAPFVLLLIKVVQDVRSA